MIQEIGYDNLSDDNSIIEFNSRLIWGLTSVILFYVAILNVLFSCYLIVQNFRRFDLNKWMSFLMLLVPVAGIVYIFCGDIFDLSGGAGEMLIDNSITELQCAPALIVDYSMTLSATSVFLTTIAMFTVLFRPKKSGIRDLKRRFRQFKASIYMATMFLAAGIVQVFCLYRWTTLGFENIIDRNIIIKLADSLFVSGSIIYTSVFLCMFIPVSIILGNWSRQIAIANISSNEKNEIDDWLKQNQLYRSPKRVLGNFAVLITPTLITIIYEIFTSASEL